MSSDHNSTCNDNEVRHGRHLWDNIAGLSGDKGKMSANLKIMRSSEWQVLFYRSPPRGGGITYAFLAQGLFSSNYSSAFVCPANKISPINLSLNFLLGHRVNILAFITEGLLFCERTNLQHYLISSYYVCKLTTQQWR